MPTAQPECYRVSVRLALVLPQPKVSISSLWAMNTYLNSGFGFEIDRPPG